MSNNTLNTVKGTIELLTKFYESPSLAHTNALILIEQELPLLRDALDDIEWTEKGLAEWRDVALSNEKQAQAAQATARIAITHLQAVLNQSRTHADQQAADTAARDWLVSIGSDPT
jgi:hypothetical protein